MTGGRPAPANADRVIPEIAERVRVDKEAVTTGRVRLVKRVESDEHEVEAPLTVEAVGVERVPVDRVVPEGEPPPGPRHEGDVLIVPVLEERVVVTKQVVVTEELRVTRQRAERVDRQTVTTRRETVDVERLDGDA